MSINTAISKWIDKSEPDFYTLFIKAWIPYNSWYMHNFYDEDATPKRTTDKDIIGYIKNNSNVYKDKIITLLRNSDDESNNFKLLISNLYYQLENTPIPNVNERISFNSICISDNTNSNGPLTISESDFAVTGKKDTLLPRTSARWVFEVNDTRTRTTRTISRISLMKCSLTELHTNNDFNSLANKYKSSVEKCLNEIDPNKKISVMIPPERRRGKYIEPQHSICIDNNKNLYFTDNLEDVSKSVIQILYELRCKLFHGEIEPSNTNSGVFEQAFYIQRVLIKALR